MGKCGWTAPEGSGKTQMCAICFEDSRKKYLFHKIFVRQSWAAESLSPLTIFRFCWNKTKWKLRVWILLENCQFLYKILKITIFMFVSAAWYGGWRCGWSLSGTDRRMVESLTTCHCIRISDICIISLLFLVSCNHWFCIKKKKNQTTFFHIVCTTCWCPAWSSYFQYIL